MSNSTSLSELFVKGGWMPVSHEAHQSFLKHTCHKAAERKKRRTGGPPLLKAVQDFKTFIEKDGKLLMGFREMIRRAKITGVLLRSFLAYNDSLCALD
jgi:hypothetical protein